MDVRMPDVDGIEATRRIVVDETSPRVLVLTTFDLDEYRLRRAPRRRERLPAQGRAGGAAADRDPGRRRGRLALRPVGDAPADRRVLAPRALDRCHRRRSTELTARESSRCCGSSPRASRTPRSRPHLVVSEHTVKTHVAHILQKLDLRDRTQAVVLAYESGLVRPGGATLPE